jgi:hypothetical protein
MTELTDVKQAREDRIKKAMGIGKEPTVEFALDSARYTSQLSYALSWYGINMNQKEAEVWVHAYVKKNHPTCLTNIKAAKYFEIEQFAKLIRLLNRDQYLSDEHKQSLTAKIEALSEKISKQKVEAVEESANVTETKKRPTVLEATESLFRTHCAEFDAAIDDLITKFETDFKAKSYLSTASVSPTVCNKVVKVLEAYKAEFEEAYKDNDAYEAYDLYTKPNLRKIMKAIDVLIADVNEYVGASKVVKVIKTRRSTPPSKVVAKLQYMKEEKSLGIQSVLPTNIVGAGEVWLYDTATRRVRVLVANAGGITASGSTLKNFDPEKSFVRTLRKPEEFFKPLGAKPGKRELNSAFKALKTAQSAANGRTNENVIILFAK